MTRFRHGVGVGEVNREMDVRISSWASYSRQTTHPADGDPAAPNLPVLPGTNPL